MGPKGVQNHYDLMPLGDVMRVDVESLIDPTGAVVVLWTTSRALWEGDAHLVLASWHVEPRSLHTWAKAGLGLGRFGRSNTEHFIVATRGVVDVDFRSVPTIHTWPRGRHSEKPDGFFDMISEACPSPRIELFARKRRLGWDAWGNEVESDWDVPA